MTSKLLPVERLCEEIGLRRAAGDTVVFTNGCFDILHAGHVRYLTAARSEGDLLVVGLNSDDSVRRIKVAGRPIVAQNERAEVLCGLTCVDYVVLFDEADPLRLIEAVGPDVLVKGADWAEDRIVGADAVRSRGGRVVRIEMVPGVSTSEIIRRIVVRFA